jgi:hypothetical protein
VFLSALDNPPQLPKEMKDAITRQKKQVRGESKAG